MPSTEDLKSLQGSFYWGSFQPPSLESSTNGAEAGRALSAQQVPSDSSLLALIDQPHLVNPNFKALLHLLSTFPCHFSYHLLPETGHSAHLLPFLNRQGPCISPVQRNPQDARKGSQPGHVASVLPCHQPPSSWLHIATASLLQSLLTPKSMEIFTVKNSTAYH